MKYLFQSQRIACESERGSERESESESESEKVKEGQENAYIGSGNMALRQ